MKPAVLLTFAAFVPSAVAETVHGTLVDAADKPLAGARLSGLAVQRVEGRYRFEELLATTGKDGRFTLEKAPTQPTKELPILLMAQLADGRSAPVRLLAASARTVWKPMPTATLTVRVTDPSGKPLAGASAQVTNAFLNDAAFRRDAPVIYQMRMGGSGPVEKSDAQGVARIGGIPAGATVQYRVFGDGLLSSEGSVPLTAAGAEVKASLGPGAILSGRVLRGGKPVPDVTVIASTIVDHSQRTARARTDANGEYRIGDAYPGNVKLGADLGKLADAWVAVGSPSVSVLPGQERNGLNLVLDPGLLLRGQVLTKEGGKPVPGARINLSPQNGASILRTSDAEGRFQARVAPDEWYVSTQEVAGVRLSGQVYQRATLDTVHNPPLELRVPDAALFRPIANLTGAVVDAEGKPVAEATVQNLSSGARTKTDATGCFRFDQTTDPGNLLVAIKDGAMSRRALTVLDKLDVALALDGKATSLQGVLTDDDGKPLADAEVSLGGSIDGGYLNAIPGTKTDASGAYRFDGLFGGVDSYFLWAKKPGYGAITIQPIRTAAGEAKTLETQKMALADGTIDGQVLEPDGKPAAGATVTSQVQGVPDALTDAQGRFHLTGVPRGKHYVVAGRGNSYGAGAEGTTGQKDVTIRLNPEPKPVPGLVSGDLTGHAAPEIRVDAWTNNGSVDLKALRGKIVVIDLWAVWCGPCVASLPDVQKLSAKYAARGVTVIGIHAPGTPKEKVAAFVKAKGLTYPVALDVAEASGAGVTAKAFGYTGIPHLLVIDAKGKVVADTSEVEDVERAVRKLLGED